MLKSDSFCSGVIYDWRVAFHSGVYIRDLTLFNIGNEKTLKNGLLNFSKIRTMVIKVRKFCVFSVFVWQYNEEITFTYFVDVCSLRN